MHPRHLGLLLFCTVPIGIGLSFFFPPSSSKVQTAFQRGAKYIGSLPSTSSYPDSYLSYLYPDEHLTCPIPDCAVTYRLLDAWFNIVSLSRRSASFAAAARVQNDYADAVLTALVPAWRTANIVQSIRTTAAKGVALDTSCILGIMTHDEGLAKHVASFLDENNNWLQPMLYVQDAWRNIADETWCIRLLAAFPATQAPVATLLTKKAQEADAFLASTTDVSSRIAVLYHMIVLLRAEGSTAADRAKLRSYVLQLEDVANDPAVLRDAYVQANVLEALAQSGESSADLLTAMIRRLVAAQGSDGSWSRGNGPDGFPVFTTLRALNALLSASQPGVIAIDAAI